MRRITVGSWNCSEDGTRARIASGTNSPMPPYRRQYCSQSCGSRSPLILRTLRHSSCCTIDTPPHAGDGIERGFGNPQAAAAGDPPDLERALVNGCSSLTVSSRPVVDVSPTRPIPVLSPRNHDQIPAIYTQTLTAAETSYPLYSQLPQNSKCH